MDPVSIDNAISGPLKGGSHEPTFAGVMSFMRRRLTKDLTGADVAVWGVPFDIFDGDPQFPSRKDPFEALAVIDCGDCFFEYEKIAEAPGHIENQAAQIVGAGVHLITLGGDHFVTLPLLRAHKSVHGPLALVQFDAHQDTWDDDGTKISHGTFATRAVAEGLIDPARSIQIGIRTVAPQDYGIEVLDIDQCEALGPAGIAARIRQRVGPGPCYLTFDIDCLDPAFAPGTGTPVAGGMTSREVLSVIRRLGELDWRGMDVVEVSPPHDVSDITAVAASTVVQVYLQILAARRHG